MKVGERRGRLNLGKENIGKMKRKNFDKTAKFCGSWNHFHLIFSVIKYLIICAFQICELGKKTFLDKVSHNEMKMFKMTQLVIEQNAL